MSQSAPIIADLERHKQGFDFTQDELAQRVSVVTAAAIYSYMDAQVDADNAPWIALADGYARWKERHFPGQPIGVLTGHMKALAQLLGELEITPHLLKQTYGIDEQARLLAEWFQEGYDDQNRPPRSFYDLNDLAVAALDDFFDRYLAELVGN